MLSSRMNCLRYKKQVINSSLIVSKLFVIKQKIKRINKSKDNRKPISDPLITNFPGF